MLSNSGSTSSAHYDATSLQSLADITQPAQTLSQETRSSLTRGIARYQAWLSLLFVALVAWGAWYVFARLIAVWRIS